MIRSLNLACESWSILIQDPLNHMALYFLGPKVRRHSEELWYASRSGSNNNFGAVIVRLQFPWVHRNMSSAEPFTLIPSLLLTLENRWSIKTKCKVGDIGEPWGIPHSGEHFYLPSPIKTHISFFTAIIMLRKTNNLVHIFPEAPKRIPLWQTESRATSISKVTACSCSSLRKV